MNIPITITEDAKARLAKILALDPDATNLTLSIAKNKGCGGNEYKWGHVKEIPAGHDVVPVTDTFSIYIPVLDSLNLFGMTIDFGPDENAKSVGSESFKFINPNETGRCGCGESVSFGKPSVG